MKTVIVLMSTYNGGNYLKAQIDSILSQEGINLQILVRDDGSTDNTLQILQEYQSKGFLSYYTGKNLGPAKSFMELVCNASNADYYAFADQDDYWLPNKLSSAINKIQENSNMDIPSLYYSKPLWTDQNLKPFNKQPTLAPIKSFTKSIVYHNVAGCTMVFNKKLQEIIKQYTPMSSIMHDEWIFKLCLAISGQIIFDNDSFVYYRQHANNVCGGEQNFNKIWKRRLYNLFYKNKNYVNAFKELVDNYGSIITDNNLILCKKIIDYKKGWLYKIRLLKTFSIYTTYIRKNFIFVLKILLGTY